jgi:predicted nucleic acid-binding Zn ribbon protein
MKKEDPMKRVRNCERCWLEYKKANPADLHIDDRDLCLGCVEAEGLDAIDGETIAPPLCAKLELSAEASRAGEEKQDPNPEQQDLARSTTPTPTKVKQRVSRAKQRPPKPCEECGKAFVPKQERSRFCSPECQDRAWHKTHPSAADKASRTCKGRGCSNQFVPKRKDQRFCSLACRNSMRYPDEASNRPKSKPRSAYQGAKAEAPSAHATATITVTEERLNHFLVTLPLDQKADIVSQYLGRN